MNHLELFIAPNLRYREVMCPATRIAVMTFGALSAWTTLRAMFGQPIRIVSGYRSPEHNAAIGGSPVSRHMRGEAFDFAVSSFARASMNPYGRGVFELLARAGFRGIHRGAGRLHGDVRAEPSFLEYYLDGGRLHWRPDPEAARWYREIVERWG